MTSPDRYHGRPCRKCGSTERYASNRTCTTCSKAYAQGRYLPRESETARRRDGRKAHPLYSTWANMIQRCHNPNVPCYPRYGGRGIRVCDRWRIGENAFWYFVQDMGPRPIDPDTGRFCTIDRIDRLGPYSPENCRWATRRQQDANRRYPWQKIGAEEKAKIALLRRYGFTLTEIAKHLGVTRHTVARYAPERTWRYWLHRARPTIEEVLSWHEPDDAQKAA